MTYLIQIALLFDWLLRWFANTFPAING